MSDRNAPYARLARRLRGLRREDLLSPVASAAGEIRTLATMIERAERAGDIDRARLLKCESMKCRAVYERAVHHVIEAIGDEPDGDDLVSALLGTGERLLADQLLDDE
jgi:hypothetical protein